MWILNLDFRHREQHREHLGYGIARVSANIYILFDESLGTNKSSTLYLRKIGGRYIFDQVVFEHLCPLL